MSVKVFIDGSSGTTGLRIADRLAARPEIELLSISAEGRKDVNERAKVINSADLAFLCLPDAASQEVMPLLRPDVKVLDTSTAFRTDAAWDYGFPELKGQKEKIKNSDRVAVPGCYASGFISIARPLVELGLAPKDYPFSCTGISGYSGGGKKMIAEYESADRPAHSKLDAPKSYGLSLAHKHLPEMKEISGLAHTPMFVPVVCDYYCGMQVLVPLDLTVAGTTAEAVAAGLADYYKDAATVKVHALNEPLPENGLYSNAMAGTDRMELYLTVNAAGDQMMLVSLFDNLGKGSSGAAVQCMNLMLGLPEMQKSSGLAHTPMFVPVVCDYYCGMQVLVPLDLTLAGTTAEAVAAALADYYKDAATVKVHGLNEPLPENGLYSNAMAGTDRMELYLTVNAAGDQMMLVSLFDNLGKGSSGAAVQCMNLMLGLEETKGLE